MDNVSVIIRNKNEENWIGHSIQSCLEFLNLPEIIVVDNNSVDESLEIVRSFRHDSSLPPNKNRYGEVSVLDILNVRFVPLTNEQDNHMCIF